MTKEHLTSIDTLMLRADDDASPNHGTGVMVLAAPVDYERLKLTLEARLLCFARFRQRVVEPVLPWRPPSWQDDRDFDLRYHLRKASLPPPGDQTSLQELVSLLAGTPLDLGRPLWQVHYVQDYGPKSVLIWRVHHSLGDGVALMHVLLSLASSDPDMPLPLLQTDCRDQQPHSSSASEPKGRTRAVRSLVRKGWDLLSHPPSSAEMARLGRDASAVVQELMLSSPDTDTALRGSPSEAKRVAWSGPLPLADIKAVGSRLCGTVNDVLLTAVTGALRCYLQDRGDPVTDVRMRALIPVSVRPPGTEGDLGNRIGIVLLPMPVDVAGRLDRFRELKRRMDEYKDTLEAPVIYTAMNTFGRAPATVVSPLIDHLCSRATVVVTNVKGPQEPLFLAGARLEEFMFWIPRFGGIGLGISILSYNGLVRLGVISDRDVVSDPQAVITAFHEEFDALLALAQTLEATPALDDLSAEPDDTQSRLDQAGTPEAGSQKPASTSTPDNE
jgi:diacylglycerol O-acyltransferase